jgi:N-acetylglucosamine kinase-like BadF-type ATPase
LTLPSSPLTIPPSPFGVVSLPAPPPPPHRALFLGLDAGGTKTRALLSDGSGALLGQGAGGPGNLTNASRAAVSASFREAIDGARSSAALSPDAPIAGVCAGAAGAGAAEQRDSLRALLQALVPGAQVTIVTDLVVAFAGALGGEPGAVVISGTGSGAFAASADGRTGRAGGFGPFLSDEGSGFAIVRSALARVLRAHDHGEPPTTLAAALLAAFAVENPEDLARLPADPAFIAARFPVILQHAPTDDGARALLASAGEELAALAAAALARAGITTPHVAVARCGGVLAEDGPHVAALQRRLAALRPGASLVAPLGSPAEGALRLARQRHDAGPLLTTLVQEPVRGPR